MADAGRGHALLRVKVHAHASRERVERKSADQFEVWVRAKPLEGKANAAVAALLAQALDADVRRLRIVRGAASRNKLFELMGTD